MNSLVFASWATAETQINLMSTSSNASAFYVPSQGHSRAADIASRHLWLGVRNAPVPCCPCLPTCLIVKLLRRRVERSVRHVPLLSCCCQANEAKPSGLVGLATVLPATGGKEPVRPAGHRAKSLAAVVMLLFLAQLLLPPGSSSVHLAAPQIGVSTAFTT